MLFTSLKSNTNYARQVNSRMLTIDTAPIPLYTHASK